MNIPPLWIFCINLLILTIYSEHLKIRVKRIVGGKAAAIPPEDDPVIFVTRGKKYAEIYGEHDTEAGFYAFKGIRFGEPPFGQKRFQRPKEMPLEGELRALQWGPPCPQINEEGDVIGHEDCLFLNVFVPTLPDVENTKYPVLIWIHGGGFRRGSASQYDMKKLVAKKLIVVSIQYRLGSLGFISSGTPDLPGNNGIFDMMLAVRWVRKYIEFFGGDTKKITAFGHEVGASSAMLLGLSKLTSEMLNGLIAMSGSSLSNFAIDKDPANTAKMIAAANNCSTENILTMVNCLKEVSTDNIVNVDFKIDNISKSDGFISSVTEMKGARPVIEGLDDNRTLPNFTPDSPENTLSFGEFQNPPPLLIGVTKNEAQGAVLGENKPELTTKMSQDPEYFNNQLIPKLQKKVPIFNITKYFVPNAFSKYLKIYNNAKQTLESIVDALGDALFNVPAYLTVKYWAKKNKAILYSFDHIGNRHAGSKFLAGSPIVSKNPPPRTVNHGDDLGYIFDWNTIIGEKISNKENIYKNDEEVTETFTDMIAQFARSGTYVIKDEFGRDIPTFFSENENNYISVGRKPKLMANFRYCEMGLWIGIAQRLQSATCNFLRTTSETVNKVVEKTPAKVFEKVDSAVQKVPGIPGSTLFSLGRKNGVDSKDNTTNSGQGFRLFPSIGKIFKVKRMN